MKNYTALHLQEDDVVFEVDGETTWKSKNQVVFPRYVIRKDKKENIVLHWRDLIDELPVIRQNMKFSERLGRVMIELNPKDTKLKHYNPIEKIALLRKSEKHPFFSQINNLCDVLEQIGIDTNKLGIRGSLLIDKYNESSDIDLLIYGRENKETLYNNLEEFYKNPHISILLSNKQITEELYLRRRDHFPDINREYFLLHERRRVQGIIDNKTRFVFSIIEETVEKSPTKKIIPVSPASIIGKVIDSTDAFYDPARMQVELRKLSFSNVSSDVRLKAEATKNVHKGDTVRIETYGDPICAVAMFPGDIVRVKGVLEKVETTEEKESYQLAIRPIDNFTKQIKIVKSVGKSLW